MNFVTVSTHELAEAVIATPDRGVCVVLAELGTDAAYAKFCPGYRIAHTSASRVNSTVAALMRDVLKVSLEEANAAAALAHFGSWDRALCTLTAFCRYRNKHLPWPSPTTSIVTDARTEFGHRLLRAPARQIVVPVVAGARSPRERPPVAPDIVDFALTTWSPGASRGDQL